MTLFDVSLYALEHYRVRDGWSQCPARHPVRISGHAVSIVRCQRPAGHPVRGIGKGHQVYKPGKAEVLAEW